MASTTPALGMAPTLTLAPLRSHASSCTALPGSLRDLNSSRDPTGPRICPVVRRFSPSRRQHSSNSEYSQRRGATSALVSASDQVDYPSQPLKPKSGAVVIGGGPAGIAAALALTKLRGWSDVTVIEKAEDLTWADPDRSYVYSIDSRGMRCATMLGLDDNLKTAGVDLREVTITIVDATGKVTSRKIPAKDDTKTTYWMPRATLMQILSEGVERFNSATSEPQLNIRVLTSAKVSRLQKLKGEGADPDRLAVHVIKKKAGSGATGESYKEEVLFPSLVLGCDGINSIVRTTLENWALEHADEKPSLSFSLNTYPSPATGLRFKVLQLPPDPVTKDGLVLNNPSMGVLTGSWKGMPLRLGLLPVRDMCPGRTGNIITKPNHPFWSIPIGDTNAYKAAFQEAFPQVDWESLVSEQTFRAFAASEGGVFPAPQASDGVGFVLDGPDSLPNRCAVLLIGDAAHAFPPDLGQGVNSALEDVESLVNILSTNSDDVASSAAAYQNERGPEADAIARLVQVGLPYQYQQDVVMARLNLLGFLVRQGLNSALGGLIAPPIFKMVQEPSLKYSQMLARDVEANQRISAGIGGLAALLTLLAINTL